MLVAEYNHKSDTLAQLLQEVHRCRQQKEDALRSLRVLQQEITDLRALSHIGTWRREADSDIPVWSDQAYVIHGLPIGMPLTRSGVIQLIMEEDRKRVLAAYDEGMAKKEPFRVVFRIKRPDGEIRVLHTDNQVSENPDSGVVTLHGAVHDITDPAHSVERLSQVSGVFPPDCLVANIDGIVVRANGSMRRRLRTVEPGGSIFQMFSSGKSHDVLEAAMDRVESNRKPRKIRLVYEGLDESVESEYTLDPWLVNETLSGFILSPSLYSDSGQDSISGPVMPGQGLPISGAWEFELATKKAIFSEGMYDIIGVSRDAPPMSITQFRELVHPEDRDGYLENVEHFYSTLEPVTFSFRMTSMDGISKRVIAHMEAVSRTCPLSHAFGTLTDVSQQQELRDEARRKDLRMRSMQESLEQMNLRLLEANLRLSKVQEEERSRIAVDLHDQAGGLITSLNLALNLIEQEGPENHLGSVRKMLDDLGSQIRQTTRELRPSVLNRFGVEEAVRQLSTDLSARANLSLSLQINPLDVRLKGKEETDVFRIAREAMLNVVRHANASSMEVWLGSTPEHIHLAVQDDGDGFNLDEARTRGSIGLESMSDRADSLGGRIEIKTRPGGGTCVELLIPKE